MTFDPHSHEEAQHEGISMMAMALAHARRGLVDPAYRVTALEAVVWYLGQMVDEHHVPDLTPR